MREESLPKKVRRLGREYAAMARGRMPSQWEGKLAFGYERGYWAAFNEIAAQVERLDLAVGEWEANGDDVALVNDHIDPFTQPFLDYGDTSKVAS